jgi:hypothetical protein
MLKKRTNGAGVGVGVVAPQVLLLLLLQQLLWSGSDAFLPQSVPSPVCRHRYPSTNRLFFFFFFDGKDKDKEEKVDDFRSSSFPLFYRHLDDNHDIMKEEEEEEDGGNNDSMLLFQKGLQTHQDNIIDDDDDDDDGWTMKEEWALLDALSKFTVGSGEQCRTFWAQLMAATPLLARYSEKGLVKRLDELQQQQQQQTTKESSSSSFVSSYGPSPPLLHHWTMNMMMDHHHHHDARGGGGGRLSGQTEDGRSIWVTAHVVGRLADDPISTLSSFSSNHDSVAYAMAGGYVEAVGGRVYELGSPAVRTRAVAVSSNNNNLASMKDSFHDHDDHDDHDDGDDNRTSNHSLLPWWVPATTATLTALVTSCVLSACIGYGAGLSIIQDEYHHHNYNPETILYNQEQQQQQQRAVAAAAARSHAPGPVAASAYATENSNYNDGVVLTPRQQRERLQRRVGTEQRMIQMIQDKMASDQVELQNMK